jgi:hypothetical protein
MLPLTAAGAGLMRLDEEDSNMLQQLYPRAESAETMMSAACMPPAAQVLPP